MLNPSINFSKLKIIEEKKAANSSGPSLVKIISNSKGKSNLFISNGTNFKAFKVSRL